MEDETLPNLNEKEQEFRIRKLELETRMLTYQSQPKHLKFLRLQAAASVASFLTAGVAIAALSFSSYQWFATQRQGRSDKIDERLDSALTRLSNPTPSARVAAVVALRSFLDEPNKRIHYQVLRAYTSMLSVEESANVRNAIVTQLRGLSNSPVENDVLQESFMDLISQNRVLVRDGNLSSIEENEKAKANPIRAKAQSNAEAINALLRAGCRAQDFSYLFLNEARMEGLNLTNANFDHAILSFANFQGSDLSHASFNFADLRYARFERATLRFAKITRKPERTDSTPGAFMDDPLIAALKLDLHGIGKDLSDPDFGFRVLTSPLPYFTGADLTDADFSGFPIFPVSQSDVKAYFDVEDGIFRSAKLQGADFRQAAVFGVVGDGGKEAFPFQIFMNESLFAFEDTNLALFNATIVPGKPMRQTRVKWDKDEIGRLFKDADTSNAKFDEAFSAWAGL